MPWGGRAAWIGGGVEADGGGEGLRDAPPGARLLHVLGWRPPQGLRPHVAGSAAAAEAPLHFAQWQLRTRIVKGESDGKFAAAERVYRRAALEALRCARNGPVQQPPPLRPEDDYEVYLHWPKEEEEEEEEEEKTEDGGGGPKAPRGPRYTVELPELSDKEGAESTRIRVSLPCLPVLVQTFDGCVFVFD